MPALLAVLSNPAFVQAPPPAARREYRLRDVHAQYVGMGVKMFRRSVRFTPAEFEALHTELEPHLRRRRTPMSTRNQLMLFLMYLATHVQFLHLGVLFGCHEGTAARHVDAARVSVPNTPVEQGHSARDAQRQASAHEWRPPSQRVKHAFS